MNPPESPAPEQARSNRKCPQKMRHDINLAKQILPQYERLKEKILLEMEAERQILPIQTRLYRKTIRKEEIER